MEKWMIELEANQSDEAGIQEGNIVKKLEEKKLYTACAENRQIEAWICNGPRGNVETRRRNEEDGSSLFKGHLFGRTKKNCRNILGFRRGQKGANEGLNAALLILVGEALFDIVPKDQ